MIHFKNALLFLIPLMSSCSGSNEDLKQYILKTRGQMIPFTQSEPQWTSPLVFSYPQQHGLFNPFKPRIKEEQSFENPAFKNRKKKQSLDATIVQIKYAKAKDIALLIQENSAFSKQAKISVDDRTNSLWVQGFGRKIQDLRRVIQRLDVPVQQVLIEARIVEVNKEFSQDMGIKWGLSQSRPLEGGYPLPTQGASSGAFLKERLNVDLGSGPGHALNPASLGVALATLNDGIILDLELSALESEGRAELISSPRLLTTNQQTAVIESGQEIPYQEAASEGATAIAFKKAVLSLKVTPQITPDGKVLMELQINQDTASPNTFNGVPAIFTKEIKTHVLVDHAQTVVLGGIYKHDKNKAINRVPFFGELPLLGVLFRNKRISLKDDELLIFITPKIINNNLSLPFKGWQNQRSSILEK